MHNGGGAKRKLRSRFFEKSQAIAESQFLAAAHTFRSFFSLELRRDAFVLSCKTSRFNERTGQKGAGGRGGGVARSAISLDIASRTRRMIYEAMRFFPCVHLRERLVRGAMHTQPVKSYARARMHA